MRLTTYENPVYPGYLADPFVFVDDGVYWAVGTGERDASGSALSSSAPGIFPLLRSQDLASWKAVGHALVRPEPSLGHTFWAPEVIRHESSFYLYYSVGFDDRLHHLRVAKSSTPGGPYLDCGVALTDIEHGPFAIDPHPFRDRDGRVYLFHARDLLDVDERSGVRAGTALVVAELETMARLSDRVDTVLRARCDWQRFLADRAMYGRRFDWHTLEGPCVVEHDARYYCFYSGGRWDSADYGVDFAVAGHVRGPYSGAGSEDGPRVLRSLSGHALGPGHNSVFVGPRGTQYLAYHAWDAGRTARRLYIDPLVWTSDGPRCTGPSHGPQRFDDPRRRGSG